MAGIRVVRAAVPLLSVAAGAVIAMAQSGTSAMADTWLYAQWGATGVLGADVPGPYPIGAGLLFWITPWDVGPPPVVWTFLMAVVVLAAVIYLRRQARPQAALIWGAACVLAPVLIFGRLDMMSVVAATVAVILLDKGRMGLSGVMLAFAALIKVWPLVLAPLWLRPGARRAWASGLGSAAAAWLVVVMAGGTQFWGWATFASGRGLQIETLTGNVVMAVRALRGASPSETVWFNKFIISWEIVDTPLLANVAVVVVAVLCAAIIMWAWWSWRAAGFPDGGLGWLSLLIVTGTLLAGPVLSPQFAVWLLLPVVLLADRPDRQARLAAWLCLTVIAISQVIYPGVYTGYVSLDPLAISVVLARNALIVALFVLAARNLRQRRSEELNSGQQDVSSPGVEPRSQG
jgi:uncharacterized membrane protein